MKSQGFPSKTKIQINIMQREREREREHGEVSEKSVKNDIFALTKIIPVIIMTGYP